jgi:hypothetical protein
MMLSTAAGRTSLAISRRPLFLASVVRNFSDEPKKAVRKVKAKKNKKSDGEKGGKARDLEVILAALDADKTKPPPADEEESARREEIRKQYTIGRFKQHNEDNHDLTCKMRMKQHALKMLPRNSKLKEQALEIDDTNPPRWRTLPAWTAPIPGFNPNKFMTLEE